MPVRENILASTLVRDDFQRAIVALDQPDSGVMASQLVGFLEANDLPLSMEGQEQELSTYDLFVFWHALAMAIPLGVGNAAHSGPIFLPWHRMYLIRLEEACQQVLDNPDFGLPYWDWAADGHLPAQDQWRTDLWTAEYLGEARGSVRSGPLADVRVRLVQSPRDGVLYSVDPRPIVRAAGLDPQAPDLPPKSDETASLEQTAYDQPPWNQSPHGHRNVLEGWADGPRLHNRVHVWVGGDMTPGSSPNDPAFFLNHCNVDRIWEEWMTRRGRNYLPRRNQGPQGHRVDSLMMAVLGDAMTPADVLDPSPWYTYDRPIPPRA